MTTTTTPRATDQQTRALLATLAELDAWRANVRVAFATAQRAGRALTLIELDRLLRSMPATPTRPNRRHP